jgi:hypothetical protein
MAATPEAAVKKSIREMLSGHYYHQPTTGGYGRSGVLDFTCCIGGHFLGIEAKSVDSKYGSKGPTALQWDEIDKIRAAGGVAMSVDETTLHVLHGVLHELEAKRHGVAVWLAEKTLSRHTRPNTTPTTDTQPTIRKTRTK